MFYETKKEIIEKAESGSLVLNDDIWVFITSNQVYEVFPFLLKKYSVLAGDLMNATVSENFYKFLVGYFDALPHDKKLNILYNSIKEGESEPMALKLSEIIKELNLFDFDKSMELLKNDDFKIQKRGLRLVTYDKPFYNLQDHQDLQTIRDFIKKTFVERGKRTTKKHLLSSKEKDVWACECGKINDLGDYCTDCSKDIYGFKYSEIKPLDVDTYIQQKIELIAEYVQ